MLEHIDFTRKVGSTTLPDKKLRDLIVHFSEYRLRNEDFEFPDLLGAAYEYLIRDFADSAGKKGGEFYTPRPVVRMMVRLMDPQEGHSVYDPCCGSGGMLILSKEYLEEQGGDPRRLNLFGQETSGSVWAIAKMNMLLHGVSSADLRNDDTLTDPQHVEGGELVRFDRILTNPPFSIGYTPSQNFPERFHYGSVPEGAKKADLMFLQHLVACLKSDGRLATVMPHGVLFRGGDEKRIRAGLEDLVRVIREQGIRSIALPPLGCGNGGLDWNEVRPRIEAALGDLDEVRVLIFEPTAEYQNVAKRSGVEKLTPARALIAELVRRYWVLGIECSLLEVQKLAWLMERRIVAHGLDNPLRLEFQPHRYGPYSDRLRHLLNGLDGSYLHSEKRINDATPEEVVWFDEARRDRLGTYLRSTEAMPYAQALEEVDALIDGFQSPLGMEALATLDWLISQEHVEPTVEAIKEGLRHWPDDVAGQRKLRLFSDRLITLALERLTGEAIHPSVLAAER